MFWNSRHLDVVKPISNTSSETFGNNFGPTIYANVPIELSYDRNYLIVDDASYASNWGTYQGVNSMYIFAVHRTAGSKYIGKMRLYHFRLYNGDTLVRDFIPVLDQNDTPCLYDRVSRTLFYNVGTGDFIAGPVITE